MHGKLTAIGIEIIVDDLDRAVEYFTGVLGCPLLNRGPSPLMPGEVAAIDAGNIVISLLKLEAIGPGAMMSISRPRFAQLVMGGEPADVEAAFDTAVAAGLSVARMPGGKFNVSPEAMEGVVGVEFAVTTVPIEQQ